MSQLSLLYENDFSNWTAGTAELLRQGRFAELDIDHLIEELGDMGTFQRHELVNRLRVLLAHLLKWQFQYPQLTQRWAEIEGRTWRNAIIEQRAALRYLLDKNPGLQAALADSILESYAQAVDLAAQQSGMSPTAFPVECPYRQGQVLDRDFYPPQG